LSFILYSWNELRSNASSELTLRLYSALTKQGEEPALAFSAPVSTMLETLQAQSTPLNFSENPDREGNPKTGNTCNALSGRP